MVQTFYTGFFKKKNRTSADLVNFFHTATPHQLNLLHEFSQQHLGHAPSFGHSVLPWRFPSVAPETWNYLGQATRQPLHEFARRMTSGSDQSKKASGVISGIGDALSTAGKLA